MLYAIITIGIIVGIYLIVANATTTSPDDKVTQYMQSEFRHA